MVKKQPPARKSQRQRFIDFAREHEANDPEALDRAMGDLAKEPKATPKPPKKT